MDAIGVRLESAPPRRGDAKGIVERSFGTLQAKFKPYMPGVVSGNKVKKHGEKDYRVEAAVARSDFVEIMLYSILAHNLNKPYGRHLFLIWLLVKSLKKLKQKRKFVQLPLKAMFRLGRSRAKKCGGDGRS